jgi:hypothetical protein
MTKEYAPNIASICRTFQCNSSKLQNMQPAVSYPAFPYVRNIWIKVNETYNANWNMEASSLSIKYSACRNFKAYTKFCALNEHHAMKAYWGSWVMAPRILDLGARWRWVVSFTSRPLYPQGNSLWYPLGTRLGGPKSRSGCSGEEKNCEPLPGLELPISQPIFQRYTTELSLLASLLYGLN